MLCKEKIIFGVKLFLEQVLKKKDKSCPFSWWDIFTLPSIFKAGKSSPPGCRKQKCSCDKPETTSSIRLYIYVSQLFTQTLRCENRAAACRSSESPCRRTTPAHTQNSVDMCMFVSLSVSLLFVRGRSVPVVWALSCPSVWPHLSLSPHVLSHINVLHCLSFSLKPTDQWDPRVSRLYDWVFAQLQIKPN